MGACRRQNLLKDFVAFKCNSAYNILNNIFCCNILLHKTDGTGAVSMRFDDINLAPYSGKEPFVFLSYSHKDKSDAEEIIRKLNTTISVFRYV